MKNKSVISNGFSVKIYQKSHKLEWDQFIGQAKNATFLFGRDFMEYHSHRFTDHSLLVYDKKRLVAVLPANIDDGVLYSHQGLSYGGLVLKKDLTFERVLGIFKEVLAFLDDSGIKTLQLKLLPKIYHLLPSDEIDYLLFVLGARLTRRDIASCIDYAARLPIRSSVRLRGIKRAINQDMEVRQEMDFRPFWEEVLTPNLMQVHNQKPVHSLAEIGLLHSRFPNNIKQFDVYMDTGIVGGATIFETDAVAHTQYISANEIGKKYGALDFLFSELLGHFSHKKYFDFGISNEMQGMKVNKGLLHWKESFGGRSIAHDFYEVKTENHHLLNNVYL